MLNRVRAKFMKPAASTIEAPPAAATPPPSAPTPSLAPVPTWSLPPPTPLLLPTPTPTSVKSEGRVEDRLDLVALQSCASPEVRDCAIRLQHALNASERHERCSEKIRQALRPYEQADGSLPQDVAKQVAALEVSVAEHARDITFDLGALPDALIGQVMKYLTPKDLVALGAASKSLRQSGRDDRLWTHQMVARLSQLALASLPEDIKRKTEVRLGMWIQQCKSVDRINATDRVATETFADEASLSPQSKEALSNAYDGLARVYFDSFITYGWQRKPDCFKPSPALHQALLRLLRSEKIGDASMWLYATAQDVVEIVQNRLKAHRFARIVTDDLGAIALLRKKLHEGPREISEPLHHAIQVTWLDATGKQFLLQSPELDRPQA